MDKAHEIVEKIVKAYFEQPDKSLKDIFGEYMEDLSEDETKAFYERLKEIVN